MQSSSDSSSSSSSDDDDEVIMLLNSTTTITSHSIESDSGDSTDSENKWGGSPKGKSRNIPRDFEGAYERLILRYFSGAESLYNEVQFERRFGMPRSAINRLWEAFDGAEPFVQKTDRVTRKLGIRPLVRFVSAILQLKYGDCADRLDDNLQLFETVSNEALKGFCMVVAQKFQWLHK